VHDDVVDDANIRRGFFSINALWKNKIAVLVGDYLLAKGLLLSINKNEIEILRIVSEAVREMSEGELLQMEKTRRLDIDEAVYYEIIRQKTATLISSACATGAASAGCNATIIEKARQMGEWIGMAFQIKDDLLDFGSDDIGKPRGIDIKEKKLTLPIIYTIKNASAKQRREIINIIKNENDKPHKVQFVLKCVSESGGLDYATLKMNEFKQKALECLNDFQDSESNEALKALITYTTERLK
jgi:octaprenyl-diphosphate synthase